MSFSPLYTAVDRGDLAEVKHILSARVKGFKIEEGYKGPNGEDYSPFFRAIEKANPDIIKALLDAGASLTRHSVFFSAAGGYALASPLDAVIDKYLELPSFAEMVDGIPALKKALSTPTGRVRYDNVCYTKLHNVVSGRDHKKLRMLLELGVDPNQGAVEADGVSHGSALQIAIQFGDVESVRLLLDHGTNPNFGFKRRDGLHDHPLLHLFKKAAEFRTDNDDDIAKILMARSDLVVPGGLRKFLADNVQGQPARLEALLAEIPADYAPPVERRPLPKVDFVCPTVPATASSSRAVLKTLVSATATIAAYTASRASTNGPGVAPSIGAGAGDGMVSVGTAAALAAAAAVTAVALLAGGVALGYYLRPAAPAVPAVAAPVRGVFEGQGQPAARRHGGVHRRGQYD